MTACAMGPWTCLESKCEMSYIEVKVYTCSGLMMPWGFLAIQQSQWVGVILPYSSWNERKWPSILSILSNAENYKVTLTIVWVYVVL